MSDEEVKEQFSRLVTRGEAFVHRSGACVAKSVKSWQNACVRWLRVNVPDSALQGEALLVPPPIGERYGDRGITAGDVSKVQRVLKVMYKARELLPFLAVDLGGKQPRPDNARKVFIVHGHNDALKVNVARLLERLDLKPIILHEQPNMGRTIIEKFVDHSDVAFAIVLLTGDDKGGVASADVADYRLRARQNVILELGYFMGRLSRKRVVAIYQKDVEIPSDYTGVLFIPYDENGVWPLHLAKEIKAAGIAIDLNKI